MKQKIERLRSLMEKATVGPWRFSPWHLEEGPPAVRAPSTTGGWIICTTAGDSDAELIVEAINALPDLLSHIDALEARVEGKGSDWFNGDVDCDGNELVTLPKDELDKYKDQVRYTCQRAEAAERALAEAVEAARKLCTAIDKQGDHGSYDRDVIGECPVCDAWRELDATISKITEGKSE